MNRASTMTMTWEVTAIGAGTRVDIRADDVPDGISADDHAAGLASSLTNLAAHLEQRCSSISKGVARPTMCDGARLFRCWSSTPPT